MATKNVTFDPDSGVPFSVNLDMYSGADFTANFNILNTANSAIDRDWETELPNQDQK